MRFKEFLNEVATTMTATDADEVYAAITLHCSDAITAARAGKVLFRGIQSSELFVKGNGGDRNPSHEYMGARMYRLWDSLPSWHSKPSRLNCYICSTYKPTAMKYAGASGNVYAVFPFNGSKMGVCPSSDFNTSFIKRIKQLIGKSLVVNALAVMFGVVGKELNPSFSESDLKDMKKFLVTITPKKLQGISNGKILGELMSSTGENNLFDALDTALDPDLAGFKFITSASALPTGDHEVWVNGKCIMVKLDKLSTNKQVTELWEKLKIKPSVMT